MQQKTVKHIFLFFIVYLPIQYILVGIIGLADSEPWPAFVFPGFKSVYSTEGTVEIEEPIIYAIEIDGQPQQRIQISPSVLFEGLPASQLQGFLRSNFRNQIEFSSETKNWFRERLQLYYPDTSFDEIHVEWVTYTYEQNDNSAGIIDQETTQINTIILN